MLLSLILLIVILIGATAGVYYLIRYLKDPNYDYTDQTMTLRSDEDVIQMKEAASIINSIKNRRESLPGSRRVSLDDVTGEFVNFKNTKLARALSCDSVMSEVEENAYDEYGNPIALYQPVNQYGASFRYEIPDITSFMKNPTDFFRLRSGSMEVGADETPWSPPSVTDALINSLPSALISLSYLPTAERLSVVIVRVKIPVNAMANYGNSMANYSNAMSSYGNSVPSSGVSLKSLFIKAYLIDDKTGKKTCKKKTSIKPLEAPIRGYQNVSYNELMIFKLPINQLTITSVRLTGFGIIRGQLINVVNETRNETIVNCVDTMNGSKEPAVTIAQHSSTRRRSSRSTVDETGDQMVSFGHIVLGSNSPSPLAISHFNSMISTMRKPITMWHVFQSLGESSQNNVRESSQKSVGDNSQNIHGNDSVGEYYQVSVTENPVPSGGINYEAQNYTGSWLGQTYDQWSTANQGQVVTLQNDSSATYSSNFHDVKL